jgi:hypothetical protein
MSQQELQPDVSVTVFPAQFSEAAAQAVSVLREQTSVKVQDAGQAVPVSLGVRYPAGWNLVALPLQTRSRRPGVVFPGSTSNSLFSYQKVYTLEETLLRGRGYWLHFPEEVTLDYDGLAQVPLQLSLQLGWNLIAGGSYELSPDQIVDESGILLEGTLIGWENLYEPSSTLQPGRGFWIQTSRAGQISVPSNLVQPRQNTNSPVLLSESGLFSAVEISAGTVKVRRYFDGPSDLNLPEGAYTLPEISPYGTDIRLDGDAWLQTNPTAAIHLHELPTNQATITFSAPTAEPNRSYHVRFVTPEGVGETLVFTPGQTIRIPTGTRSIQVDAEHTSPVEFALDQNFPNPFNPTTTIRFALPEAGPVRLEVFTITGQRVALIVDEHRQAGWHTTEFDASRFASGIYLYRLQAGQQNHTRKLTLIK